MLTDKDGNQHPIPKPLDAFQLEKLARAQQVAIYGERVVLGMPTSVKAISDSEGGNIWRGLAEAMAAVGDEDEPDTDTPA